MPNYANITIIGHLGQDPRVSEVSGKTVANFSVAVSRKTKGEEQVTWFECAAWSKTGELVAQYLKKGSVALVSGTPALETYTKRDGQPGAKVTVLVDKVVFLDSRRETVAPGEKTAEEAPELQGDGFGKLKKMMAEANAAPASDSVPF